MNDVLNVSSNQEISQPGDVDSSCSSYLCDESKDIRCFSTGSESDEKKTLSLSEIGDKVKVIN